MNTLTTYLMKYYKLQDKILLVYRSSLHSTWRDRCFYLDEKYNPNTPYNHRSVLNNEVIIEYDNDDPEENKRLIKEVAKRLDKDGMKYSLWSSGNKSIHLHIFIDIKEAHSIPLLKKTFIRYYTKDLPLPDLQVCAPNHLIRAEFGIHEKTGKAKERIYSSAGYPVVNEVPAKIWDFYSENRRESLARRIVRNDSELTALKGFKYIVTAHEFREAEDGRERALFMLIHVLKPQYKDRKEDLIKFLQEWYRYSSGHKLTEKQIEQKVNYHWNRVYSISENYLNELLESIKRTDLIEKKKEL